MASAGPLGRWAARRRPGEPAANPKSPSEDRLVLCAGWRGGEEKRAAGSAFATFAFFFVPGRGRSHARAPYSAGECCSVQSPRIEACGCSSRQRSSLSQRTLPTASRTPAGRVRRVLRFQGDKKSMNARHGSDSTKNRVHDV